MLMTKEHVQKRDLEQGKDLDGGGLEERKVLWTSRSRKLWARLKEGKSRLRKIGCVVSEILLETTEGM